MAGFINIGNGLSEMGKSIAESAGQAGLLAQKAEVERAQAELTNQLIGARESTGRAEEHKYRSQELDDRQEFETQRDERQGQQRLKEIEVGHQNTLSEISARSKAQISAAVAERGLDVNDIKEIETDESGKKYGITRTGKKIDLGITGPNSADEKLLARAERFALVKRTVVDDEGNKTTEDSIDPTKAAEFLTRQGRGDLAKGYQKAKAPTAPPMPSGLPAGSQYSPSRNQWRDPSGKLYDASGKPVGGGGGAGKGPKTAGLINMPMPPQGL